MVFLHSHGVGTARAVRIFKTYGADAVQVMSQNPFSALWKVTRSTSPANTSCVIDSGCELIETTVSAISA